MDKESIINALDCSYQGNSEQIMQAQQFLLNMASNPSEYSEILIDIMSNEEIQSMTRVAAAIQFKYLLQNKEFFDFFTIDMIINIILETSPLVHVQLQPILAQIIDKYLKEDMEQGIQVLLSIVEMCFNSDTKHIFIGINIIRFIFKSNNYKITLEIGSKKSLANKFVVPQFNSLLNADLDKLYPYFQHCMLLTANLLLNYSDLQSLNSWIETIVRILDQETELSKEIDKDAAKFATGIIELKQNILEKHMAFSIFNSIVNRIKRNQMSYKGILYSLRFIYQFMNNESFVSELLNQENELLNFATEILFEIFVLDSNSIQQINEDLFNFLLFRHNSNKYQIFDTPISCSIYILKKICKKGYFIEEIAQFALLQISQNLENEKNDEKIYGKLYGSIHFASILVKYLDSSFPEIVIQSLSSSIQKNQENQQSCYFRMTLLFLFLSNACVESLDLFILCLNSLTNESFPPILHYFCAISIPNFFKFFNIESIMSEIESNLNIPVFIKKLLELNSNYPTNQVTFSIKFIFEYFLMFLEPVSIDVIQELFSIYTQFSSDDNENKKEICSSINELSSMMKNKKQSIDFYSNSLAINMKLLTEIEQDDYENLLDVMNNLIRNLLEGIDQSDLNSLNDIFIQVPEFLFELINESNDYTIYPLIIEILKNLSIHPLNDISLNYISQPISKILQILLNKYSDQNDSEFNDISQYPLIKGINKLSQILFIVLKDEENLQPFLEIFTQLNQQNFADSIAAIATLSPIQTFSNELNFRICMNLASPAAFLLCFEHVTQNLDDMPKFIIDDKQEIEKVININYEKLLQEIEKINKELNPKDDENEEEGEDELIFLNISDDPAIFNLISIKDFYQNLQNSE